MTIRTGRILTGALVLATAWLAGCRASRPDPVDFSEGPRNFLSRDYGDIYDRWTRHRREVSGQGLEIEAWATLKSWEFREAFVEHYAEVYQLPVEAKQVLRASEMEGSRAAFEFHVSVQMNDYRSNDLDQTASAWRVALVDGAGDEVAPLSIDKLELPPAYENEFFPRKTAFSKAYLIRFARTAADVATDFGGLETGQLTLRIAGPPATANLLWDIKQ